MDQQASDKQLARRNFALKKGGPAVFDDQSSLKQRASNKAEKFPHIDPFVGGNNSSTSASGMTNPASGNVAQERPSGTNAKQMAGNHRRSSQSQHIQPNSN